MRLEIYIPKDRIDNNSESMNEAIVIEQIYDRVKYFGCEPGKVDINTDSDNLIVLIPVQKVTSKLKLYYEYEITND